MNPDNARNIDLDPRVYEKLTSIMGDEVDCDDKQFFLFHRRKPEMIDAEQRANVLESARRQIDQLRQVFGNIGSVHLVDCCGEQQVLHSDLSLLADLTALLSSALEPDATASVVLMDYFAPIDAATDFSSTDIEVRGLFDSDVTEEKVARALQEIDDIDPTVDPGTFALPEKDLELIIEGAIQAMRDALPDDLPDTLQ